MASQTQIPITYLNLSDVEIFLNEDYVICGQGDKSYKDRVANKKSEELLFARKDDYKVASSNEKSSIIKNVYDEHIRIGLRFVKKTTAGQWYIHNDPDATEGCHKVLRDRIQNRLRELSERIYLDQVSEKDIVHDENYRKHEARAANQELKRRLQELKQPAKGDVTPFWIVYHGLRDDGYRFVMNDDRRNKFYCYHEPPTVSNMKSKKRNDEPPTVKSIIERIERYFKYVSKQCVTDNLNLSINNNNNSNNDHHHQEQHEDEEQGDNNNNNVMPTPDFISAESMRRRSSQEFYGKSESELQPDFRSQQLSDPSIKSKPKRIKTGQKSDIINIEEDPKPSPEHPIFSSLTAKQLVSHLASLDINFVASWQMKCTGILERLLRQDKAWIFNKPVDPVDAPDYLDHIKRPMDLGTIRSQLDGGLYHSIDEFVNDVNLTFNNAMNYNQNEPSQTVYNMAVDLKTIFEREIHQLYDDEINENRRRNEACTLCGQKEMYFKHPDYFCNGMVCSRRRIERNEDFYIGGDDQYVWCVPCYDKLDNKQTIKLDGRLISKFEELEESWIKCEYCGNWVHQICGLFNPIQNNTHPSQYCCPKCLLKEKLRSTDSNTPPKPRRLSAADLPRTKLSNWLERNVTTIGLATKFAASENVELDEALHQIESCGKICIRQVTSIQQKLQVGELMRARYNYKNYPEEFTFRSKCIVVFQEIDGVDVILFALYVHEHDEKCPPPNQRLVYISYLDNVNYMQPSKIRTLLYHEILIAYLDYARNRGFAKVHIWSSPPSVEGDDYIFFAKPKDQKTPDHKRLRQWYITMLTECQKRKIVDEITNMYDLYSKDKNLDATNVPYFEGDCFQIKSEKIIKELLEERKKKTNPGRKKKARDPVMVKFCKIIKSTKEDYIVARLHQSGDGEEPFVENRETSETFRMDENETVFDSLHAHRYPDGSNNVDKWNGNESNVIDDDNEEIDCKVLYDRQVFLNLCRTNNYQFDNLHRAKHTSMMLLWRLHNQGCTRKQGNDIYCNTPSST